MVLDVPVPDPPSLSGPQTRGDYEAYGGPLDTEDDYRREEVETILQDGAWRDAFEEWAGDTGMIAAEFEIVAALDLVDQFDFYWDPASDEVGYRAPELPPDAREDVDDPQNVDLELDSLGRTVSEMLENDYLLRDDETFGFFDDDYTGDLGDTERL
ncbi:hypothetical protein VB773_16325 [Haloarculaceae archaeon H-GB2-1]|nr:hypothetical protein [Haloarculaceae archaeon H-GB1-1]MEA5387499.1 hypothetical protein [Haloarculaceae archaeon H-GB11]MEA5408981.1 hypothetical protein [Haloarculaceae archaeon H-GB2-1]